ncbi:hypothetical protein [Rubripirellula reticaptiva]|uniref:Uncharacterized protein n=1 Tax=Rubripirellula reticaptiva TaxID=2528013 RepID=A0A5C6F652_9BACT|nr:hypothetical protein [Rubripirellula reticaptiva]TWU56004.1 hypothetical protein Poly59_23070 [Rubripirellula reticaptiva]
MHAFLRSLFFRRSVLDENEPVVSPSTVAPDQADAANCDQRAQDDRASMFIDDPDPFGRDWQWLRDPEKKK